MFVNDFDQHRSSVEIASDHADLALYRIISTLDSMAVLYHQPDFKRAADTVASARRFVRPYMHKSDLENTHG